MYVCVGWQWNFSASICYSLQGKKGKNQETEEWSFFHITLHSDCKEIPSDRAQTDFGHLMHTLLWFTCSFSTLTLEVVQSLNLMPWNFKLCSWCLNHSIWTQGWHQRLRVDTRYFQPMCCSTLVCPERSASVPWIFGAQLLETTEKTRLVFAALWLEQLSVVTNICSSSSTNGASPVSCRPSGGRGTGNLLLHTIAQETELKNLEESLGSWK